jgi:hypothetical protein
MSGYSLSDKIRFWYDPVTGERGVQVRVVNKTGGNSAKGYCVSPDGTTPTDLGVIYTPVGVPDPVGIVYDVVANGADMWIWISGIVEIYVNGNATVRQFARVPATGDAVTTAGTLTNEAAPTSPFATDKHFQEVGHIFKARTGAGLTLAVLHWL